jgi:tripartite-type tricarboxylate transporter receptor subunit TctC
MHAPFASDDQTVPSLTNGDTRLRSIVAAVLGAVLLAAPLSPASAQSALPSRTIKFIVPFPGGGSNDVTARIVADKLQAQWGQTIVIENRTGAGGNIGADLAAQAEPDGTTLMFSPPGPLAINVSLYRQLTYHPEDFVPVTVLSTMANLVTIRPEIGADTLAAFIALARANPGKLSFGSQGNGSTPHLSGSMFTSMTGVNLVHVPYRGENLVINDMLGGHVDAFFGTVAPVLPFYRDGKLKVLAVADVKRAAQLPDVPTVAEAGLPDFISTSWFAVVGPPHMAPALAQRFSADIAEVLKLPDVQAKFRAIGTEPDGRGPAETAAFLRQETARWREVIVRNKIRID